MLSNLTSSSEMKSLPENKKSYSTPKLEVYGEVTSLTLGGSPGSGDSGGADPTELP